MMRYVTMDLRNARFPLTGAEYAAVGQDLVKQMREQVNDREAVPAIAYLLDRLNNHKAMSPSSLYTELTHREYGIFFKVYY